MEYTDGNSFGEAAVLELHDVTAGYGKAPVLKEISAVFPRGRLTALVGPNGCGKSTLLKAVMGFVPMTGRVDLAGEDLARISRRARAGRIAWLPQENACPEYMTLGELVELGGYARMPILGGPSVADRAAFARALATVGLSDQAHRPVNALSGGQRQRAFIAMVLAQEAELVLLDEPVNHLDLRFQLDVLDLMQKICRNEGRTVVAVLHDLNLAAAYADHLVMLRAGRVVHEGPLAAVLSAQTVAEVFGVEAEIFERSGRRVCLPLAAGARA